MPTRNFLRWTHLLAFLLSAVLIRWSVVPSLGAEVHLELADYSLLVLSILCIAVGGYIITDFFNLTTDSINTPDKVWIGKTSSQSRALKLYFGLNLTGLLLAFYLFLSLPFHKIGFVFYAVVFSSLAIIGYTIWWKKIAVLGNVLISVLVGLGIFSLGISLIDDVQNPVVGFIISAYSLLAFLLSLAKTLIQNILNTKGDYYCEIKTLPILIGKKRTNYVVFSLLIFTVLLLLSVTLTYMLSIKLLVFYVFALIILPLIFISKKVLAASSKKEYKQISFHLELVCLLGIGSMLTFIIL
jgi:4-hydroxybenzoate polyprenyltransferase